MVLCSVHEIKHQLIYLKKPVHLTFILLGSPTAHLSQETLTWPIIINIPFLLLGLENHHGLSSRKTWIISIEILR